MAVVPHRADLICTCLAHRSQPLRCRRRAQKMGSPLDYPLDSPEGESWPQRTVFGGPTPLTKQVKTAVGPIGPHHASLLRWVRIFKHTYTNPLSNRMATCGLRGPLSAVLGPCVDSCYCCIIPVWRTCHSRWNARMGLKMGGQIDDPPDSQGGESRPQRTTFGCATPLTKPVKNTLKTAVGTVGPHRADLH